ncbi:MAG: serine/threonine protein kinase [Bryobacteraceae bacterium]|nr:serine/threonine protein kinase [Bryobacteraceae bacterium]
MDDRWHRVEELFAVSVDLPVSSRPAFLEVACGEDLDLRAEVESLLAADAGADSRMEVAVARAAETLSPEEPLAEGRSLGVYRILREIGRGGMGAVYLAERADQRFRKKVAIKMARLSAGGAFLAERFRRERQILAMLEHPNIARILDGGEATDGTPYLVMEYVEGSTITAFAEAGQLDLRARLRLFMKVAAAVQYAHQLLVVHRDLKPGNILVTSAGEPKLLDFGIAKLLEPDVLSGAAMETSTGVRLLSPDYASPEQVRGHAITTATDVYSLGAVLFELLTAVRPHKLKDYTAIEIDQVVCETLTERPSAVLARSGASRTNLSGKVDADLDVVVLKAMHKEPGRRYASVEHLTDDLERYLNGFPVLARSDSTHYRARKFVRRHRLAVTAAALLLTTVIGGIATTSWQAARAQEQARRADVRFRQVRHLANRFLFEFDENIEKLKGSTPARELVVATALEYLDSLSADMNDTYELRPELAIAYRKLGDIQGGPRAASLGRSEDALKSYKTALDIGERLFAEGRRDPGQLENMITSARTLGLLERRLRPHDGETSYVTRLTDSITTAEELVKQKRDAGTLRLLASGYRELGEYFADSNRATQAEQWYSRALPVYEEIFRLNPVLRSERGVLINTLLLGDVSTMLGDLERALGLYERSLAGWVRLASSPSAGQSEQRSLMGAHLSLGALLGDPSIPNLGVRNRAEKETASGLVISEGLAIADPENRTGRLDLAYASAQLGRILAATKPANSVRHLRKALALAEEVARTSPTDQVYRRHVLRYRTDLGTGLAAAALLSEASREFKSVMADVEAMEKPGVTFQLIGGEARRELAMVMYRAGSGDEAKRYALQALRSVEEYLKSHLDSIEMIDDLSLFYEAAARAHGSSQVSVEAQYLEKARQLWVEWPKHGHSSKFDLSRLQELQKWK